MTRAATGRVWVAAIAIAAGLSSMGCWSTTIRSGRTPGQTPIMYDERWHHGFIFGIAEASGPYDLQDACPNGWAEVHTETPFLQGLVQAITQGAIYNPQEITVTCTGQATAPASRRQLRPIPALADRRRPATP